MLLQIFLAAQAKQSAVIGTKYGIYTSSHELSIDSKTWILEKY